jgi:hypothetical protein
MSVFRRWLQRRIQRAFLFEYWDGSKLRRQDGERLWRRYATIPLFSDPLFLRAVQEGKPEETERFFEEIARFFDVPRYDDATNTGLTDEELARVYLNFLGWVEQKKTPRNALPTSSRTAETESLQSGQPAPMKSSD